MRGVSDDRHVNRLRGADILHGRHRLGRVRVGGNHDGIETIWGRLKTAGNRMCGAWPVICGNRSLVNSVTDGKTSLSRRGRYSRESRFDSERGKWDWCVNLFKEEKMLVLSRSKGESITITGPDGTVISLMVVDVRGQRIRLGMDAPKDWKIMRVELKEQRNEGS